MSNRINLSSFVNMTQRFKCYVNERDNRNDDISFRDHNSILFQEEGYKARIAYEAREILQFAQWNESWIGTGKIFERVFKAIELSANLIFLNNKTDFNNHFRSDNQAYDSRSERAIYNIYCGKNEKQAFEFATKVFGAKYATLAYLFFVKDDERFLPVSPDNFERCFRQLGIDFTMSRRCSWENYCEYIDIIKEVKDMLPQYINIKHGLSLLDAHSFVWILGEKKFMEWESESATENEIYDPEELSYATVNDNNAYPIVSFSCGGTYDLVINNNVHAHPVKKGFPSKISSYLMVRATGGYSEALYKVLDTIELNPLDETAVGQLSVQYESVKRYIKERIASFGFKNAPLPYRFYLLRKVYSFNPAYVMNPNPQGFRYLSFEDVGIKSLGGIEEKKYIVPTRDTFINSLSLPEGFEAKRFEGMNRVHFKYLGIGFAVIDMKVNNYNLGSRASYMDDIGVKDYSITQNLGPNRAVLKNIPYDDTTVLYKLFGYISGNGISSGDFEEQQVKLEDQTIEKEIHDSHLVGTDKIAVVKARVNQGVFRDRLIRKYHKCCLCGTDEESLLVASHIKPWVDSSPDERVDVNNGLLLCPNHDKLFDRGYISFDDEGRIMISNVLSENNRVFLNVDSDDRINLDDFSKSYMKYHRENIFIDRDGESAVEHIDDESEGTNPDENFELTSLQATKFGPLPDSLINFEVEHVGYGDGVIKCVDSRTFQIDVKFKDHNEMKTFVFPGCFLSSKLTLKNDEDQIGLEEHLKKYNF